MNEFATQIIYNAIISFCSVALSVSAGGYIGYRTAISVSNKNSHAAAVAKFRAAFAPALAKLFLADKDDFAEARAFFKEAILHHAAAIEEFRPFTRDSVAYKKAWDEYHDEIGIFSYNHGSPVNIPDNIASREYKIKQKYGNTVSFYSAITSKINKIMHAAAM